ncbi:hypothetical protein [Flavisphingomonas formosensis]|uniref:hypothetical protein n=1 Tax=Flavisphingomonas formosensis TaxID=861534 RepID=UPI0012FADFAE|nr:hypothetical protein [Sphingomonas formosensis]
MISHIRTGKAHRLIAVALAALTALLVAGLTARSFGDLLIGIVAGALALPLVLVLLRPMLEDGPRAHGF